MSCIHWDSSKKEQWLLKARSTIYLFVWLHIYYTVDSTIRNFLCGLYSISLSLLILRLKSFSLGQQDLFLVGSFAITNFEIIYLLFLSNTSKTIFTLQLKSNLRHCIIFVFSISIVFNMKYLSSPKHSSLAILSCHSLWVQVVISILSICFAITVTLEWSLL